jgi:hypothetical protein
MGAIASTPGEAQNGESLAIDRDLTINENETDFKTNRFCQYDAPTTNLTNREVAENVNNMGLLKLPNIN